MAAYAALTSLMQIIDQLERHPSPPITLRKHQVQSLTKIVTSLLKFLEGYNSGDEAYPLEMRIADAAYKAEDDIESKIVGRIRSSRKSSSLEADSFHDVQGVIQEMELIQKHVLEIKVAVNTTPEPQKSIIRSSSLTGKMINNMIPVEFEKDGAFNELRDKLARRQPQSRLVIPITGMAGIGKSTLAQKIFEDALIKYCFDIRAWVTISQQFNKHEVIYEILSQVMGKKSEKQEEKQAEELYKYLFGRRYLIVMDDVWSIDVWKEMQFILGDSNSGSRIIVTTRQSHLTSEFPSSNYSLNMEPLDVERSWSLFSKIVFGEETFPPPLKKIGKKIVEKCRGLPLSIVVIGGLLAKSDHKRKYWETIEQKISSIVNSENEEYCMKLLKLSYNHLFAYLKPCFLYMGTFEEDKKIRVSRLIKLWVSEGFLKPENGKSLETTGKEFLKDLIDRNLILVGGLGSTGEIKSCKVHDLLRELCLKEAEKERFYHVIGHHSPQGLHNQRRIYFPAGISSSSKRVHLDSLESMSHVRSLTFHDGKVGVVLQNSRELRILNTPHKLKKRYHMYHLQDVIDKLVNTRYLAIPIHSSKKLSSSVNFLWNLHTLRIFSDGEKGSIIAPIEIWNMSQLRHVEFRHRKLSLPDPPSGNNGSSTVILENLESLKGVVNFKCGEDVVKRIPNIKKLEIKYKKDKEIFEKVDGDYYCLRNLERLHKLESFTCNKNGGNDVFLQNITFPQSLVKLTMGSYKNSVRWEEMLENIGLLPLLQKLILIGGVFQTSNWETVESRFPSLKYMGMISCGGFKQWTMTESSHFPYLEHLHLSGLDELEEIPAKIGDVSTLKSMVLDNCCDAVVKSAKRIVEEQQEEDNLTFHVLVIIYDKKQLSLQSLAGPNFKVESKVVATPTFTLPIYLFFAFLIVFISLASAFYLY